jgi:hypothetical protein
VFLGQIYEVETIYFFVIIFGFTSITFDLSNFNIFGEDILIVERNVFTDVFL